MRPSRMIVKPAHVCQMAKPHHVHLKHVRQVMLKLPHINWREKFSFGQIQATSNAHLDRNSVMRVTSVPVLIMAFMFYVQKNRVLLIKYRSKIRVHIKKRNWRQTPFFPWSWKDVTLGMLFKIIATPADALKRENTSALNSTVMK